MNKVLPLVSVNIRTFNSEKTLTQTLESVKQQTYPRMEIIVSDGGSLDKSVEVAKEYGAKVGFAEKLGDARYQNYKRSRGEYILSLDSDQTMDKNLISRCVSVCQKKNIDALTISEKSLIEKGTFLEKLIAYDKWVIDKNKDADVVFGTACPRFFRKKLLDKIAWPKELAIFDDTILYSEILESHAKVDYLSYPSIWHHEVSSWIVLVKKFYRYGKGYLGALKERPATIAAHSLPRRSYFSSPAFSKPAYFLGLLVLYFVKIASASIGVLSSVIRNNILKLRGLKALGFLVRRFVGAEIRRSEKYTSLHPSSQTRSVSRRRTKQTC